LKAGEKVVEERMGEDEKLQVQSQIASDTKETEQLKLESLSKSAEVRARRKATVLVPTTPPAKAAVKPAPPELTPDQAEAEVAKHVAEGDKLASQISEDQRNTIRKLAKESGLPVPKIKENLRNTCGVENVNELSKQDADEVIKLFRLGNERHIDLQIMEIRSLFDKLGLTDEKIKDILSRAGVESIDDLSIKHASQLIEKLTEVLDKADPVPF